MSLPVKTTVDDIDGIVSYLKTKPTGATVAEARGVVDGRLLDGRKLKGYQAWGIVQIDSERLKLTDAGRRMAREPEAREAILLEAVRSIPAYRAAIEWAYHQKFSELTVNDLAANWHEHQREALGTDNDSSIKAAVTCFFNLAGGAGLGAYIVGRAGGATRLDLNAQAVARVVEAGPSTPPWTDPSAESGKDQAETGEALNTNDDEVDSVDRNEDDRGPARATQAEAVTDAVRVFISHGKNMDVVEQVKTVLDLADIAWEVAVEEESAAIPVPDKVFGAMRSCNAGIICVSAEEDTHGEVELRLNENVLIEIGAAFVLYDRRVVLLWDRRIPVPSNLQGLYRCEFDGDELSWTAGTKLMKAIQGFKRA